MPGMPKAKASAARTEWTVTPTLIKATIKPEAVILPARKAIAIDGKGAPASEDFQQALAALYGVTYGLKFARKKTGRGTPFKVAALEGRWTAEGWTDPSALPPPERWTWRLRLAVPPDTTAAEVAQTIREVTSKKGGKLESSPIAPRIFVESIPETRCARILHIGPYADEPRSFATLTPTIQASNLHPTHGHIEVYLGDPRRTAPDKLKTVLLKELQ
jgi:hypothetical protein